MGIRNYLSLLHLVILFIALPQIVSCASKTEEASNNAIDSYAIQSLFGEETNPGGGNFDASLEEVLHLITQHGYAETYPDIFGEVTGSSIANAMDTARGGRHETIPESYPEAAWYHYDDETCDYACQITEYFYWSLTTLLGAQSSRSEEIEDEWELSTVEQLQDTDSTVYTLLTDSQYSLPTTLPDTSYSTSEFSVTSLPSDHSLLDKYFSKYVSVFGVNVFATEETNDEKILHAARIIAQYLDNNEDGTVDNADVVEALVTKKASLVMAPTEDDLEDLF